jgi:HNH endonuclease/AP2 domain
MELTQERLKEILNYDPETGIWTRNENGKIAGSLHHSGYIYIRVDGHKTKYGAHRLAWFYMIGKWPKHQIDHINMIKNDNLWCNLREADWSKNNANRIRRKDNISGCRGVSWYKTRELWLVYIQHNRKRIHIGYFEKLEEATIAYNKKFKELFGDFARLNG